MICQNCKKNDSRNVCWGEPIDRDFDGCIENKQVSKSCQERSYKAPFRISLFEEIPDPDACDDKDGSKNTADPASVLVEDPVGRKGADGVKDGEDEGIGGDNSNRVVKDSLDRGVDAGKSVYWKGVDESGNDVDE